jgi:hypothetical protein
MTEVSKPLPPHVSDCIERLLPVVDELECEGVGLGLIMPSLAEVVVRTAMKPPDDAALRLEAMMDALSQFVRCSAPVRAVHLSSPIYPTARHNPSPLKRSGSPVTLARA